MRVIFLKLASFVGLPTLEMEIGLGRPAMTDMLTEDEAVLFGLLGDGLPDLNDWNLDLPPPDSTAALATEPASSPQLASRVAVQSVDLASPWPTATVPRQARPAGHGGVGYDTCMLNSNYRLMGPCHTKLVETLASYNAEDKESDFADTIRHVERLTGEKFVLQPPDDPANGSKMRSRLRESERRISDGVNRFPFHLSQNRLCDEHRPVKRRRLISPAAAPIIAQTRVVPAMPCAPIPILSAVPLGFAFVGALGGGGVGGGTLCCGTPDGVALGSATPVHAFGGGRVGGGALSFGTSGGDALDSATPARAFGGCGGALSGSMRGGNALDGEHREQSARSMEQPCSLETWLDRIKDGYSRFAVAFEAAGVEDSIDLTRMDLGIYCKVEAALTQKCDAKPMHLKNIRLAIELLCGCGLEVPVSALPLNGAAAEEVAAATVSGLAETASAHQQHRTATLFQRMGQVELWQHQVETDRADALGRAVTRGAAHRAITFEQQRWVRIGPSPLSGDGLFADRAFAEGDLIIRYEGEACIAERGAASAHVFQARDGQHLDGAKSGVAARINWSRDPNAKLRESGGIYAKRSLCIGEEITIAYGSLYWRVHTKQPTEAASALAPSAPNRRPAKRDAKEPAACLRVVCLSGHEMAYQVFKPTMNERHLNCDGEGCDAKIASGQFGWTCHTCRDFDLCDACADPSGRGCRSWSRRSSNRPQSPR